MIAMPTARPAIEVSMGSAQDECIPYVGHNDGPIARVGIVVLPSG